MTSDYVGREFAELDEEHVEPLDDEYGVKDYLKQSSAYHEASEPSSPRPATPTKSKEKDVIYVLKNEDPKPEDPIFTDSFFYMFSFILIMFTMGYFFYISVACEIEVNDTANMTINYAIDQSMIFDQKQYDELIEI